MQFFPQRTAKKITLIHKLLNLGLSPGPLALATAIPIDHVHMLLHDFGVQRATKPGRPRERYRSLNATQQRLLVMLLSINVGLPHLANALAASPDQIVNFLKDPHTFGIGRCPRCHTPQSWVNFKTFCVKCKAAEKSRHHYE